MKITFSIHNILYEADISTPLDISIPLQFNGPQPNTYDVGIAVSKAFESGDFIGDTRRGGGCNFEEYTLIPHCNGTHTECVGHIVNDRISIQRILKDTLIPSALITVMTENAVSSVDSYSPSKTAGDMIISKKMLEEALRDVFPGFLEGLMIRTLPNEESKKNRLYMQQQPPFFSLEAMEYIVEKGVTHLLVDIPSVDRTFDEGKLSTHHIFWNIQQGSHEVKKASCSSKTITEMIYVPDEIPDGIYLLNLQIASFVADATPSRPVLFQLKEC